MNGGKTRSKIINQQNKNPRKTRMEIKIPENGLCKVKSKMKTPGPTSSNDFLFWKHSELTIAMRVSGWRGLHRHCIKSWRHCRFTLITLYKKLDICLQKNTVFSTWVTSTKGWDIQKQVDDLNKITLHSNIGLLELKD